MAFRIHDSVVRGEIDNRQKGVVRGKIWLEGWEEPITLELKGNAHPDLAGCLLTFTNPLKHLRLHQFDVLDPVQRGTVGDLTASRKVRVLDRPHPKKRTQGPQPEAAFERIANALYLEWFSEVNGRVVIESADFELTISAPEWTLTPEEDEQRARDAAAGMEAFIRKLNEAIDSQKQGPKDPEAELLGFTKACFEAFRGLRGRSVQATVRYPRGDRLALTTYGLTTTLRHYNVEDVEYDDYEPILTLRPKPDDSLSVVTARLPEYDTEPRQYDRPSTEIEEELQQKMHREVDRVELNDEFEVSTETLHRFFRIVRITNAIVPETITTAEYEIEVETRENGPPSLNVQHRQI
jgi:hypothetical protein